MKAYNLNIDFNELRNQKEILINMIQDWGESDDENQRQNAEYVEGLLGLLDEIQDQAVDVHGISEYVVFGFEREVDIDEDMAGEWVKINND